MIIARTCLFCLTALMLSACSSSPVIEDHYYSLVLAKSENTSPPDRQSASMRLIVGPVQLPSYLTARGLPLQVGPNRISSASHHLWAEPLDEAIAKVLARDLEAYSRGISVERESGRFTVDEDCRVRAEFDAFHPTNASRAVVKGRYWISSDDGNNRHEFELSRTLTDDGYAHAVDTLRGMLADLAQRIATDIENHNVCSGTEDEYPAASRPG